MEAQLGLPILSDSYPQMQILNASDVESASVLQPSVRRDCRPCRLPPSQLVVTVIIWLSVWQQYQLRDRRARDAWHRHLRENQTLKHAHDALLLVQELPRATKRTVVSSSVTKLEAYASLETRS
jgi:hypothetical protein